MKPTAHLIQLLVDPWVGKSMPNDVAVLFAAGLRLLERLVRHETFQISKLNPQDSAEQLFIKRRAGENDCD
jgi:hypothetical protein